MLTLDAAIWARTSSFSSRKQHLRWFRSRILNVRSGLIFVNGLGWKLFTFWITSRWSGRPSRNSFQHGQLSCQWDIHLSRRVSYPRPFIWVQTCCAFLLTPFSPHLLRTGFGSVLLLDQMVQLPERSKYVYHSAAWRAVILSFQEVWCQALDWLWWRAKTFEVPKFVFQQFGDFFGGFCCICVLH